MICDSHIHVGYYPRLSCNGELFYYSPARIARLMKHCGINSFIFSSTNVVWDFRARAMHLEAQELLRLCPNQAHAFFWCSLKYLKYDPNLKELPDFYEGLKIHGGESNWLAHPRLLRRLLSLAQERNWPVQIHMGKVSCDGGTIAEWEPVCKSFPQIRFNLAHCQPIDEAMPILLRNPNFFADVAFMSIDNFKRIQNIKFENQLMFGSDLPVQQRFSSTGLTHYFKQTLKIYQKNLLISSAKFLSGNFFRFLNGDC